MRKYILLFVSMICCVTSQAGVEKIQQVDKHLINNNKPDTIQQTFHGLENWVQDYSRMLPPYHLELSIDETTHIIFPSSIVYVDLGSSSIIAGKADHLSNILRIKAAVKDFTPTNFSVVTDEGCLYSFQVSYNNRPQQLNVEMADFMDNRKGGQPNNDMEIYLNKLGRQSPQLVHLIMKSIFESGKREIKNIGIKKDGMELYIQSISCFKNLMFFHCSIANNSNIPYDIDFIRFSVVDKKKIKRTVVQQRIIEPIRAYNLRTFIDEQNTQSIIFAFDKITIPDDKKLVVELYEKNGGRNLSFTISNNDLIHAIPINHLNVNLN